MGGSMTDRTGLSRRDALRAGAVALSGAAVLQPRASAARSGSRDDLTDGLTALVKKHRMPGALVGVYRAGQVRTAAAGIANLNTGAPMTSELGYLTGSITKVWSATLVMTFVDEGKLDLDAPLIAYLPHLRLADPEVTRQITTRHLLNHTSGLDAGDYILDLGEGPAANRLFVGALGKVGQLHPLGAYSSYCNGGWVLAGHLLEHLSGKSWHRLLEERVIRPLGATRTFTDAEDAVLFGAVVGSVPDPKRPGEHMATPKFLLPKTFAPAGATLLPTIHDNLLFARMHLGRGVAPNGTRIISERSAVAMATRTIDHPSGPASGYGLGWFHATPNGQVTLSHGGGSNGGRAMLVVVPEADFAYATFVNSNASDGFQAELDRWIRTGYQPGWTEPPPPPAPEGPIDPARFVGVYRRMTSKVTIRQQGGQLMVESAWVPEEAPGTEAYVIGRQVEFPMRPATPNALVSAAAPAGSRAGAWTFLEPDERGRYRLVYAGGRLARRIAD
ncbi:MAG: beta-lactamase family protein [Gemmatimonadetes bacterium]|nr:beta-lactamase family protein [Gemmatimonadota bacterium]